MILSISSPTSNRSAPLQIATHFAGKGQLRKALRGSGLSTDTYSRVHSDPVLADTIRAGRIKQVKKHVNAQSSPFTIRERKALVKATAKVKEKKTPHFYKPKQEELAPVRSSSSLDTVVPNMVEKKVRFSLSGQLSKKEIRRQKSTLAKAVASGDLKLIERLFSIILGVKAPQSILDHTKQRHTKILKQIKEQPTKFLAKAFLTQHYPSLSDSQRFHLFQEFRKGESIEPVTATPETKWSHQNYKKREKMMAAVYEKAMITGSLIDLKHMAKQKGGLEEYFEDVMRTTGGWSLSGAEDTIPVYLTTRLEKAPHSLPAAVTYLSETFKKNQDDEMLGSLYRSVLDMAVNTPASSKEEKQAILDSGMIVLTQFSPRTKRELERTFDTEFPPDEEKVQNPEIVLAFKHYLSSTPIARL